MAATGTFVVGDDVTITAESQLPTGRALARSPAHRLEASAAEHSQRGDRP
jgi:hypothetical protein